jgi:murein L,D-transpeptidase YafK
MRRIFLLAFLQVFAVVLGYTAICSACSGSETGMTPGAARYPERLYSCALTKQVDSIYVVKSRREMYVFNGDSLLKIYRISLGDTPVGHKHFQGDERTPEGLYRIFDRNPNSICHKNLGISYPNDADRAYARSCGKPTGGDIKIHGLPNGQGHIGKDHIYSDWTNGCIGVTDEEVDELYALVGRDVPILIVP